MKKTVGILVASCLSAVCAAGTLDLSGEWTVRLDPQDIGETERWFDGLDGGTTIELPGIVTEVGLGEPLALEPDLTKEVFRHLHQKHRYVGAAWYSRDVVISETRHNTVLLLERTIWKTTVWVNGQKAGSQDSLSAPHRHAVGRFLKPGLNRLVVRVDNRPQVDIGVMGHAYTDETQTIWNGLIGKIELREENPIRIKTHPLRISVEGTGELTVQVEPVNHGAPALPVWKTTVTDGEVEIPTKGLVPWSEFNPALYRVTARFRGMEKTILTGFRTVETSGRELLINGNPAFMRGTLECAIFPKTGYPPTDAAGWDKVFGTAKEYGLNHIRFHSWCPPEAAFASADRHGIYIQAELPNWTFKMGQRPEVDEFLMQEGERIMREYAHHPSFVFFSLGNELKGDFGEMDKMVEQLRSLAPHLLYTSTTYSFSKRGLLPGPVDDFFISQKTETGWVRGQGFINQTWPTTDSDYAEGLSCIDIPLITHEVGQYNVYPNLAELPKYNGNLRALGYEAIQQDLKKKGRLDEAAAYTRNSGKLAAILYKEDIERALRTPGLSGIQLLDLHDFPGQSTATVGLLDSFWDSKGILTPAEFRRFCAPVVPLLKMEKLTWRNSETFTAEIEVANFLPGFGKDVSTVWMIEDEAGQMLVESTTDGDRVEFPLSGIRKASRLKITVSAGDFSNDWNIWVYPETTAAKQGDVVIVRRYGKSLFDALAAGKNVLFLPRREELSDPLDGRFIPVFWSPLHFPNQPGSLGTVIDADHPVFAEFPTSTHTDWQWWELLAVSSSINADELGPDFDPIMQFIDKYNRNSLPVILWEAQVGKGSLLVCTLDIESDPEKRIVASQLKQSILSYMNRSAFAPSQTLSARQLASLFQARPYRMRLEKGTEHPGHPLANLQDGKPETIWHSDWRMKEESHPYSIMIELAEEMEVAGLDYVARKGNANGRVANYRVSVSPDGKTWKTVREGSVPPEKIRFDQPCSPAFIRFEALSEVNGKSHGAIAELTPVFAGGEPGVDELGLIEGFNMERRDLIIVAGQSNAVGFDSDPDQLPENKLDRQAAFCEQPNIIWVMGEDMGPELSSYGHPAVQTPNFDRLATQGARYTQAFCTAPSCTPSRNAMMTGVYQTRTDTQDQRRRGIVLPDGIQPITHLLREAGYYTALGCGFNRKTDLNFTVEKLFDGNDWSGRKEGQPFFAQITLYNTHRLKDGWDKIHRTAENPVDPADVELPPYFPDHPVCRADWARYLESIQYIDGQMGELLDRLDQEGIADNTVVIFIGDNGQCHLRGKCWLYDAGIEVPLIIRRPGHIEPGTVNDDLVSMIDVSATILDMADVALPAYLDGHPILGPRAQKRDYVFAARDLVDEVMDHIRCVRTDRYKYIRNYTPENGYTECRYVKEHRPMWPVLVKLHEQGKLNETQELLFKKVKPVEELYDLANDPYEVRNLADSPEHAAIKAELSAVLDEWIKDTGDQGLKNLDYDRQHIIRPMKGNE